ncbi:HNH/ENDO VII superfamily nuclease [Archangium gephyra]|uniref:HNH/ENDO VII superfamily nuclease n=1 Tax=Archangium gephyra TaxID=48 RepID=A0AAC8Q2E6_9BACT|nr:AHH domain-containing protein [Archangium gephyra]AKI99779.1 putative lipoprotein [Archangium gephyra]REG27695.1 HNH/ENDO VII superfamily nuclease [Archangium gephyra]
MKPRVTHALYVLLLVPLLLLAAPVGAEAGLPVLEPVGVSGYQGEAGQGLRLTFKRLEPDPTLALWTVEEAREVVEALEGEFKEAKPRLGPRLLPEAHTRTMTGLVPPPDTRPSALERRVREEYEALLGTSLLGLPGSLESARWFQALKLSPRYMGAGVREAALELFGSPAVLLSVGTSMVLYMMAWAAPEPLFSKAFAAAVTMGLLLTYSAAELYNVGLACLTLYREAEGARTREELEAAAERFGKALGGVGLRVLVTVAGAKLARGLPEVPKGGLWASLSPPRFAMAGGGVKGGLRVGAGTRAQVSVADGTVVLMGVTASTTAAAVTSAVSAARTTGACAESGQDGHHRHHLCTNKNDISENSGGPWTPRFETFFEKAGMSLEDPANIIYLRDHKGPHPEAYHRRIFERLGAALGTCRTRAECRAKLVDELDRIAGEVCTPGSTLNKLATRNP